MEHGLTAKEKRQHRVRQKVRMKANRPRLSVFRSNKYMYAQIIDDTKGETVVSVREKEVAGEKQVKRVQRASLLGKLLAEKAKKKKILEVVFDRGNFSYHGRVKALADGAREGGLRF